MGVQGLATLVNTYPQIYRDVRFMGRRLVIDGCNLLHLLYFNSGLDQNHGGEYAAFEDVIEKFVIALRDCRITPYVVLDGGTDCTDKKLETLTQRAKDRIIKAHRAAAEGSQERILPLLAKLVFRQTLDRLEVPVAQCYGEADEQIATLANEWQCPVLSNDSDFYIFELPAGLLPIDHFKWEAVEQCGSQKYIPCKSYNTSSFCIFFNIQHHLLPTFAALAGNDYVKLQRTSWAQFAPAGREKPNRLEGLLCWLRDFQQPREALEAALGLMGELSKKSKAEVLQGLSLGMAEYQIPPSSYLKMFFIHKVVPPFPAVEKTAGLVPHWMLLPLAEARLCGDILDVLQLRRMPLPTPVDHGDMPSACLTSRPIRQVMYGLLLGKAKPLQVEERDREGLELKFILVQRTYKGVIQRLDLNSLDKADPSERLQVLLEALGVPEASLNSLPPQLRLPVAVTCYWLQRAQPPPDQMMLKALLLGLTIVDTWRQRAALHPANKQRLDVNVVHAFNQWQLCLKDSIQLNQVLGYPLPEPQIARLYEGTFVHQLVHVMKTGGRLGSLLKSDRSSVKRYQTMVFIVHQFYTQETSKSSETQKTATAPQRQPLDDLTADLQQMFTLHEDEEFVTEANSAVTALEDLSLHDLVSVRTRYKTKERNNRCKIPEMSRKEECRGLDII
uniref:single-strand DNA endonuclease ASTE1 isoform X1 n=1 Tax=Monopterus albus TaxID=43700 RepID=UPI0009B43994|nr:protein asteroid homolog 1-like isoform X1 [Monopterus albus]XP_020472996.1 protein asteroid homolog 1-like isoform X2 [Monopterus albus]XP_020472997.1 protein asteroid homolog 1-like isoform X3 [Monopterus albus]